MLFIISLGTAISIILSCCCLSLINAKKFYRFFTPTSSWGWEICFRLQETDLSQSYWQSSSFCLDANQDVPGQHHPCYLQASLRRCFNVFLHHMLFFLLFLIYNIHPHIWYIFYFLYILYINIYIFYINIQYTLNLWLC